MYNLIFKSLSAIPPSLRLRLAYLQVLLLIAAIVELVGVVSIGPFIALATNPDYVNKNEMLYSIYEWVGKPSEVHFLAYAGACFVVLFILSNALLFFSQIKVIKLSNLLKASISVGLYQHYLSKDYLFHSNNHASSLINKVVNSVGRFCDGIVLSFLNINAKLFSIVALLALMMMVSASAALFIGGVLVSAYILVFYFANQKLKNNGLETTQLLRERGQLLHESFEGVKYLEFYSLQKRFSELYKSIFKRQVKLQVSNKFLSELPYYTIETLAFLVVIVVVVAFLGGAASIEQAFSDLAIICLAGYRLIPKFQQVYRGLESIKKSQAVMDEVYSDIALSQQAGDINFRSVEPGDYLALQSFEAVDVSYGYMEGASVLKNINFIVKPGEMIGLVGRSGVGKSTLLYILTGLIEADDGAVLINGVDVKKNASLKNIIGFVDSETYIFAASLKDNITLFDEQVDAGWLSEIVALACLDDVVSELDGGLDSMLGNKGSRLSSGQLQRLGFARALYRRPKILLLDEATNALDYETQQQLIKAIRSDNLSMAVILVSHRLDVRGNFDRCYQLSDSGLVEVE